MIQVSYAHVLPYMWHHDRQKPILKIEVQNQLDPTLGVLIEGHLDSGTELTIFQGDLCLAIDVKLAAGPLKTFQSAISHRPLRARLHRVKLVHEILGECEMQVAFAEDPLLRNLLGLDFFNFYKIGFQDRENRLLMQRE